MFIKNNWLRSLPVILAAALLLTTVSSYLPPGQDITPFISGSVNATPDQLNPGQYMEFKPDAKDGKVNVIIGFTGEPARGAQRQAKLVQQKTLIESLGGDVERDFSIINAVTARMPMQAVETLSKRQDVRYIEPDYKVSLIAQETPWGIDRIFGPEKYTFSTWDHSRGQGIAVAVLDTGIDENHIDLPALLGGINTVDNTHWGSDGHGHGTHMAGTIAALDNNMGVVGAAPDAGLYAVKVLNDNGRGTYSSVIAGIEWAFNNNIPIMSMSLGGGIHSYAFKDAVDAAYAGGTLLVAAAGNDGNSTDNVLYPARYSSVIAVSASDSNDKLASFSSRGPNIEFIAPGVNILSLYPGNYMVRWSGTSMAAPHVAGSAAVLWGANPDLSNLEVRNILRQTAEDLGLSSNHQGYGLVRNDLAVAQALPALSSNADLSTLAVKEGTLSPVFDSAITGYTVDVADDISSIVITPTLSDNRASMTINGKPADSGKPEAVTLGGTGTTTKIAVAVTAADRKTVKTYTTTVNRAAESVDPATWTNLTTADTQVLAYDGGVLAASVAGYGIGLYDGIWTNLTTATALAMARDGSTLVASVEGFGVWVYDGKWSQLTPYTAELLAANNGMVAASFAGQGIWLYDGNNWTNLSSDPARALAFDSGRLVVSIDNSGTWLYHNERWQQLTIETAQLVAIHGSNIAANFTGFGLWYHDGDDWKNLTPVHARALALDNGMLTASVDGFGTWLNKGNGEWNSIIGVTADLLASDNGKVAVSFERQGLWLYE